jgi:hypothetical protein
MRPATAPASTSPTPSMGASVSTRMGTMIRSRTGAPLVISGRSRSILRAARQASPQRELRAAGSPSVRDAMVVPGWVCTPWVSRSAAAVASCIAPRAS